MGTKLDDIIDILADLINKTNSSLFALRKNISDSKEHESNMEKEYTDQNTQRLRLEDELENSDIQKAVNNARANTWALNNTAKDAKNNYTDAKDAWNNSDVDFEIRSLRQIKRVVQKILTDTYPPTAASTSPGPAAETVAATTSPGPAAETAVTPPSPGTAAETAVTPPSPGPAADTAVSPPSPGPAAEMAAATTSPGN